MGQGQSSITNFFKPIVRETSLPDKSPATGTPGTAKPSARPSLRNPPGLEQNIARKPVGSGSQAGRVALSALNALTEARSETPAGKAAGFVAAVAPTVMSMVSAARDKDEASRTETSNAATSLRDVQQKNSMQAKMDDAVAKNDATAKMTDEMKEKFAQTKLNSDLAAATAKRISKAGDGLDQMV
jgi:hypothetical protein